MQPQQNPLVLQFVGQKFLEINPEDLQYVGSGGTHVVFHITGALRDKVLVLHREGNQEQGIGIQIQMEANRKVDDKLEGVYQAIIGKVGELAGYRVEKQIGNIINSDQQLDKIYANLQNTVKKSPIKVLRGHNLRLDRKCRKIYLEQHAFSPNYNTIVEFKPKTVVPDSYTLQILESVGKQVGMDIEEIRKILGEAEPVEKLRWFKVSAEYKKNKNNNINNSPLSTFNINQSNTQISQFTSAKGYKKYASSTKQHLNLLNTSIKELLGHQQSFLQTLLRLHQLFPYPCSVLPHAEINWQQVNLQSLQKQAQNAIHEILSAPQQVTLHNHHKFLQNYNCICQPPSHSQKMSPECQTLLFLISTTWKDISFLYLAYFNGHAYENPKIVILDDYLKSVIKLRTVPEKDRNLLRSYLKDCLKYRSMHSQES